MPGLTVSHHSIDMSQEQHLRPEELQVLLVHVQPYQVLTVVACIIVTPVMVAARLYTVSNYFGPLFQLPYQALSRKTNCGSVLILAIALWLTS